VQNRFGFQDDGTVDHLAVYGHRATVRRAGGGDHPLRPIDVTGAGPETLVHWRNLFGVYAEFPAEPQANRAQRVVSHGLRVVDLNGNAVHRRLESSEARCEHEPRAEIKQFLAFAGNAEVNLKVDRSEHQSLYSGRRAQRREIDEAASRFDERQHERADRQLLNCVLQVLRILGLGYDRSGGADCRAEL
jgi:hypothetical protein